MEAHAVIVIILIPIVGVCGDNGYPSRIPIGALFNRDSQEVRSAFRYTIYQNNENHQNRFKISENCVEEDLWDSFTLATEMCNQMAKGAFFLFGMNNVSTTETVNSYTNTFHMPYITPSMVSTSGLSKDGFELFLRPSYTKALVDLVRHYGWSKAYYVYDSDEGLMRLQHFFQVIHDEDHQLEVEVRRVTTVDSIEEAFAAVDDKRPEDNKRIILDVASPVADELLKRASGTDRRITKIRYHYIIEGLNINELDLQHLQHGGLNLTGLSLVNYDSSTVRVFLKEWNMLAPETWQGAGRNKIGYEAALTVDAVSVMMATLTKIQERKPELFRATFKRGRLVNNGTAGLQCKAEPAVPWKIGADVMKIMKSVVVDGLTGKIAFDAYGRRKDYKLSVLEVGTSRGLATIGNWYEKSGLNVKKDPLKSREKGMSSGINRTRIVTSIITEPYLLTKALDTNGNPLFGNDKFEGYCADLAKQVAEKVDFDYIIKPVKDGKYGIMDANGTWDGMVGELVRNEADLAIAPLTITSAREAVIDFSKPFMSLGISIMIKKMTKRSPGVFSFMAPLSYEIWMCVIFAYIGVSVVLFLVSRFSPFEWHVEDNDTVTNDFTIFNSLWFSLGAFMQQGCELSPRSMSGRMVGSVWWFFTLIIISSYTANLAAFLTVERMQSPIESADDLAGQTEIKYGTIASGSTRDFFRTSKIAVYERMWAFMSQAENNVFVTKNEDGVEKVRSSNGKYAFLTESTTNDYTNNRKPCNTIKVGSNLDSKGYGIGTPLGSDLRDRITLAVLELREKGDLQSLEKKWWYDKGECGDQNKKVKDVGASALSLAGVAGVFYILVSGLILALITAVCEFLYKSKVEARRHKTTFSEAMRSKVRISLSGKPDRGQNGGVGSPDLPVNRSMSTFTYTAPQQIISLDSFGDGAGNPHNTHTQV